MRRKSKATNVVDLKFPERRKKSDEQLVLAMRVAHSAFVATIKEAKAAGLMVSVDYGKRFGVEFITIDATRVIAPR